ncbi:hypothetical protein QE331_gp129 [Pseudomonas phage 20Sep416]|uniref:Uncharacterized protein n=2 Tax=Pakpunavirus TaxID=1921407 RepID=A0AAF0FDL8_9CAUD|nr:hypothetical protein QE331_gp129 [Pseudomonas phage 20Sep416]WFG37137.1 hypothetical protein 9081_00022 [Pseudomonas phage bmx-p3]WFG37678.1 hypothetical protein 20Sep416_00198 [Pseudomonas phage 20Sep416]
MSGVIPGTIVKLTQVGCDVTVGWPKEARYVGAYAVAVDGRDIGLPEGEIRFCSLHWSIDRDVNNGLGDYQSMLADNDRFEIVAVPGKKYYVKAVAARPDLISHYLVTSEPALYEGFESCWLKSMHEGESPFCMTFKGRVDIGGETSDELQFQTLYPEFVLEEFKEEDEAEVKVEAPVDEEKKEKVAKPAVMGYAVLDADGSPLKFCLTREEARATKRWWGGKAEGVSIVKVIKGEEVR